MPDQPIVDVVAAAAIAGCSTSLLKRYDDELQPLKIGSKPIRLYAAAVVREWAQRRAR